MPQYLTLLPSRTCLTWSALPAAAAVTAMWARFDWWAAPHISPAKAAGFDAGSLSGGVVLAGDATRSEAAAAPGRPEGVTARAALPDGRGHMAQETGEGSCTHPTTH
eukprot:CAMPEP_0174305080 /NCGR_PEP_ID=MMETSP0809-20121228/61197_1 /TAXON_ID=73025 ORGANISM="Eutreptiella gymnastica-like, Strain CCMP1594" /NCGR_SAMPLE_ID=MMETSP0809 /ASSEMBLY_ACC=CAM_ASM_000658 /LENGTH=106 /DNA_ID=CAMNT_0015411485 /DNA_START=187 /DNA_END=506 /DNA_ORIENTATION=+